jgi:hypothetical protein
MCESLYLNIFLREESRAFVNSTSSVFVNARPRSVIMQDMRRRIDRGDLDAERKEAIQVCVGIYFCLRRGKGMAADGVMQAMCDIAADRAGKLQS